MNSDKEAIDAVMKANALGVISNQQTIIELENIEIQNLKNQLELTRRRIATVSHSDLTWIEKLKTQENRLKEELSQVQEQGFKNRLSDLLQDLEEQTATIEANYTRRVLNEADFLHAKSEAYTRSSSAQIALIHEYISKTDNKEFLATLRKKEADIRQGLKCNTF